MTASTDSQEATESIPYISTELPLVIGFFLSFRLFIMLLSVRVLGLEAQTGVSISLALNFLLFMLTAFLSLGLGPLYPRSAIWRMSTTRWILAFLGFSCCSLLWSTTASLPAATAYWCAMAADVGMVALALRAAPLSHIAEGLMKGYIWGASVVAVIAWLLPVQSDLRLGDEELLGPNQIGYLCAFAIFFAQYLMIDRKGKWAVAVILLGVTLLRSLSKTSIMAFLVAESFVLMRDGSITRRAKWIVVTGAIVVLIVFSGLLTSYYDIYSNEGNSPETLTGRIGIWAFILDESFQRPWIGHGFHSVWKVVPAFGVFQARHAHNELLQQFYAYGVVGIILIAGLYGSLYRQVRRFPTGPRKTFFFALLLFILVRGVADTEPFDLSLPMWAILLISLQIEEARIVDGEARPIYSENRRELV